MKTILPIDKVVYAELRSYAWNGESSYPSASRVAKAVNISVRYFWVIIKRLEAEGLIKIQHRHGDKGNSLSNLYIFTDTEAKSDEPKKENPIKEIPKEEIPKEEIPKDEPKDTQKEPSQKGDAPEENKIRAMTFEEKLERLRLQSIMSGKNPEEALRKIGYSPGEIKDAIAQFSKP